MAKSKAKGKRNIGDGKDLKNAGNGSSEGIVGRKKNNERGLKKKKSKDTPKQNLNKKKKIKKALETKLIKRDEVESSSKMKNLFYVEDFGTPSLNFELKEEINPALLKKDEINQKSLHNNHLDHTNGVIRGPNTVGSNKNNGMGQNAGDWLADQEMYDSDERHGIPDTPGLYFHSECLKKKISNDHNNDDTMDNCMMPGLAQDERKVWKNATLKEYGWGESFADKKVTCRCIQCHLREVLPKMKNCKRLICIDLDNWGVNQLNSPEFISKPSSRWISSIVLKSKQPNQQESQDAFVWCFYGAYINQNIHLQKLTPQERENHFVIQLLNNKIPSSCFHLGSLLDLLHKNQRIHFSNCGPKKQAADLAIIKMCELMYPRLNVTVVTYDKQLGQACSKISTMRKSSVTSITVVKPNQP